MTDYRFNGSSSELIDVVFLDIDGVLLPFGEVNEEGYVEESLDDSLFPDVALKSLGGILEATGAKLVLSSTWRAKRSFIDDIIKSFRKYGEENGGILSTVDFHDTTDVHYHGGRQYEIQKWFNNQKQISPNIQVRSWLALDDEELIEGEENSKYKQNFVGHVVKTESSLGLTIKDGKDAIELMAEQVRKHKLQHPEYYR